jgi:hypothetical protein
MENGHDDTAHWRGADGRFGPGNPGRPLGARGRASRRVARAILSDFEANQEDLLPRLRRWFVPQYVQLVTRLLPRQSEDGASEPEALSEAQLARLISDARAALDRIEAGGGSLGDLEAALLGEGHNPAPVKYGDSPVKLQD